MHAHRLTPILNVSDIQQSFAWFEKLGWKKGWDWGTPPAFGGVCSGMCEIFLCQGGQGGRGVSSLKHTGGPDGDDGQEKGVWMSIWVDDVDAIHRACIANGLDVTMPPTNEPWGVREMHVRHPDGHVFRISKGIGVNLRLAAGEAVPPRSTIALVLLRPEELLIAPSGVPAEDDRQVGYAQSELGPARFGEREAYVAADRPGYVACLQPGRYRLVVWGDELRIEPAEIDVLRDGATVELRWKAK